MSDPKLALLRDGRPMHTLTQKEASLVLEEFLRLGREAQDTFLAAPLGNAPTFTLESIRPVFEFVGGRVTFQYRPFSSEVPGWVKDTPAHAKGEIVFDADSDVWIMRLSFYLGECFVRRCADLHWASGNRKSAAANMPVVTGFLSAQEMPVVMVTRNLFIRILGHQEPWSIVSTMVEQWIRSAPASCGLSD